MGQRRSFYRENKPAPTNQCNVLSYIPKLFYLLFRDRSHQVTEAGLELATLLPQLPSHWNYRHGHQAWMHSPEKQPCSPILTCSWTRLLRQQMHLWGGLYPSNVEANMLLVTLLRYKETMLII